MLKFMTVSWISSYLQVFKTMIMKIIMLYIDIEQFLTFIFFIISLQLFNYVSYISIFVNVIL